MTGAACSADSRLIPSRVELDRPGKSYTIDTVLALQKEFPQSEFFLIMGADAMMRMRHWVQADRLFSLCSLLVCPRPSCDESSVNSEIRQLTARGAKVNVLQMPPVSVSSTELRDLIMQGKDSPLLPISVQEYCAALGLYGRPGRVQQADRWLDKLFAALDPHRFAHSLAVADTAVRLARLHGINPLQAEQAGLLHDCAKCLPKKEMRGIALEHALTQDETILSSGALLHSIVGAWVARKDYGMEDPEVLNAIAYHNTGYPGMSRLAMCVCLADSIEPTREDYPGLAEARALSMVSLEGALLLSLERTADYVRGRGKFLHPRTQKTIEWLKLIH